MWDADIRNCCGAHRKYLNDREGLTEKEIIYFE